MAGGLDEQVRLWVGWYRDLTLALAHAFLAS